MKKLLVLISLAVFLSPSRSAFFNFKTDKGVGGGITQWQLSSLARGKTIVDVVRDWRSGGIRFLRTNILWPDHEVEKQFLAACKANEVAVIACGFDYNPEGIETTLPAGVWSKLVSLWPPDQYGIPWEARAVACTLIKGCNWRAGQDFILDLIRAFKSRNSDYLIACWSAAGNDCENAIWEIYRNTYGEPPGTLDSSTYGGWNQVVNQGQRKNDPEPIRGKLARVGITLPSDADFSYNTARFDAVMKAEWGLNSRWIDGGRHAYWQKNYAASGIYLGDCGPNTNSGIYTEFGVDLKQLPGRFDLLSHPPAGARIICYWNLGPIDPNDGLSGIWARPETKAIVKAKATEFAIAGMQQH